MLFDAATLAPAALVDGIALTSLRTAAVSALAVRRLARPDARRLLVFGSGPQALGHVQALREVRPIEHVQLFARDRARVEALAERVRAAGLQRGRTGRPAGRAPRERRHRLLLHHGPRAALRRGSRGGWRDGGGRRLTRARGARGRRAARRAGARRGRGALGRAAGGGRCDPGDRARHARRGVAHDARRAGRGRARSDSGRAPVSLQEHGHGLGGRGRGDASSRGGRARSRAPRALQPRSPRRSERRRPCSRSRRSRTRLPPSAAGRSAGAVPARSSSKRRAACGSRSSRG